MTLRLLCAPTPPCRAVAILLHALSLPFAVEIIAASQAAAAPDDMVPVLSDPDGEDGTPITLSQSGAILLYLAAKHGSPLLPPRRIHRAPMIQWLMWTASALQPACGALFRARATRPDEDEAAYAAAELTRLIGALDARLANRDFLAGPDLSLADIAAFPWVEAAARSLLVTPGDAVSRWRDGLGARPAFVRGMAIGH